MGDQNGYVGSDLQRAHHEGQQRAAMLAKYEGLARLRLQCRALNPRIHDGDVSAMQEGADLVQRHFGFNVAIYPQKERIGSWNYGIRTAKVGPIVDLDSFLTRVHEFGHGMSPRCSGKSPHYQAKDTFGCLQCEVDAWAHVQDLFPLNDAGFSSMRDSLRAYRQQTAGTPEAIRHVDSVMSYDRRDAALEKRRQWQQQQSLVDRWQRECREARDREYQAQQMRLKGR